VDYFHDVCMEGDGPSVELMIAMPQNGLPFGNPSGIEDGVCTGLQAAWSEFDEFVMKAYIVANQGPGPGFGNKDEAINQAFDLNPWIYAAYRVTDGFNPWTGTKWEGMSNGGRIRFKPFLNTGYQMDSSTPANWQPRDIVVEKYINQTAEVVHPPIPDEPDPIIEWQRTAAGKVDALTLSADSTVVILSGARSLRDTWYIQDHRDEDDNLIGTPGDNMHLRPIRLNVALEGDWPITGRKGLADDPNFTAGRVNQDFKYTWRVPCPAGDYQELLRRGDSFPIGKAKIPGRVITAFQPRCTQGHELWTDRRDPNTGILPNHATTRLRDVKRIAYYANVRIPTLSVGLKPGMSVGIVGNGNILCNVILKSVKFSMVGSTTDPNEKPAVPDTWIEAGPRERQLCPATRQRP
jgi:hypothetical protein